MSFIDDVSSLRKSLSSDGEALLPVDEGYETAIKRWAANAERRAAIVVRVGNAADVAVAIKFARDHTLPVAVCGGGHSPAGHSSLEGGLVIDLRKLKKVTVDPATRIIKAGGGATWFDVDAAAAQHGLATVGGTVSHTGIGGLTLGGGYGWLSGLHGLTCDNVVRFDVVTADGRELVASETSEPDLFWALRGGGQNFGVVTTFYYQGHPVTDAHFSLVALPTSAFEPAAIAAKSVLGRNPKSSLALILARPPPAHVTSILCCMIHFGTSEESREIFKPIWDLGPHVVRDERVPYTVLNTFQDPMVPHGLRRLMYSYLVTDITVDALRDVVEAFDKNPNPNVMAVFELFHLDKIMSVDHQATAFGNRRNETSFMITAGWPSAEDDDAQLAWAKSVGAALGSINTGRRYANYVENGLDAPKEAGNIWGANLARLQQIKAVYDPTNFFRHGRNIAPAPKS
eukprot:TRINITY_DN8898_c0_g1_i1.p1 TRINITY_DN8898_c0_g1~~TRINITY_DN8898_c0_g1_i1.p1  ORF type:complete len:484 (+),score=140.32 TRINITY_DN8898_c0_g1_i1:84-1454(+)